MVKALDKQGSCFQYIAEKFPNLSAEKVKEEIFLVHKLGGLCLMSYFRQL